MGGGERPPALAGGTPTLRSARRGGKAAAARICAVLRGFFWGGVTGGLVLPSLLLQVCAGSSSGRPQGRQPLVGGILSPGTCISFQVVLQPVQPLVVLPRGVRFAGPEFQAITKITAFPVAHDGFEHPGVGSLPPRKQAGARGGDRGSEGAFCPASSRRREPCPPALQCRGPLACG